MISLKKLLQKIVHTFFIGEMINIPEDIQEIKKLFQKKNIDLAFK